MTEKRFKVYKVIGSFGEWSVEDTVDDKVVFGSIMHKYEADRLCDKLNELADENEQLEKILYELSDMLQFDVENGIKSYPMKLSEYLSNALKELKKDD